MARRKSSVGKKSFANAKPLSVPEKIEENETAKNDNLSTSEAADDIQADTERQDNPTNLERNASREQASVPSRQNSLTASQSKGNLLGAKTETDLQRTSRTSLSKRTSFSEHQKEGTIATDMARAYGTTHLKDTPNHLYGLDGALISSDEDGDINVDDPLEENVNHNPFGRRIKCFVKDHWKGALSFTIFFLAGVLLAFIIQANPPWSFSTKTEIDPNSEMLRKIEEKVDRLSSVLQLLANSTESSSDDKSGISEQAVQQIVQAALERYNADKVGMADFALESSGAQIHGSYHSATYEVGAARVVLFGIPLWFDIKPPRVILQPDNSPGNCWAFKGDNGFVVIKLSKMLTPTAFSLEHIPKLLSPTGDGRIPSAPKEFTVWGWKDENGNERVKLGYYIFDNEGDFLQTFNIQRVDESEVVQYIELRILSNQGNPQYTCIYRFRVHGQPH